ncbi:YqhA family protein [Deinococcus maricopensis]|uniref:Uncharacterized protein family UPF0114 n=1 Tax=Deinococcus maricopensis (strain DSM 21211 / LMG 22137 / NRRL B-23946 / LB-34) TaxID=709986 RepID=E8U3X7_DEIML|nr:YqhA family protein [Deinococcus maricopensis]ADV65671.1 Uncharacterized protein family UPF0114 [Deinococcus maricopensis DSM 21211]
MSAPDPHPPRRPALPGWGRALGFSLLIVELGVLSSFAFALVLFIAGVAQTVTTLRGALRHLGDADATEHLLVAAVQQADTLLVATALLIISLGLQMLFVGRIERVPAWLHIRTFDDLKAKLLGIVVVALVVKFFSVAVEWDGGSGVLAYGAAIAVVILAAAAYSGMLGRAAHPTPPDHARDDDA